MGESTEGGDQRQHEHLEMSDQTDNAARAEAAARQINYEKQLSFWHTLAEFWRSTLWILYGQLVVFGYGIDGNIAGNLLAIPRFRYVMCSSASSEP